MDRFRHKLPKDELKRLGKEIAKKLVASDYKNRRVSDPTASLSDKQATKIKKYVKDFLTRAVEKYDEHQKKHGSGGAQKSQLQGASNGAADDSIKDLHLTNGTKDEDMADDDSSDVEVESPGSQELKRKRDNELLLDSASATPSEEPSIKRIRSEEVTIEPSPPPPPPPPPDAAVEDETLTEEQKALQEQEEALMRENEEAQRLEDEAIKGKNMEEKIEEMRKDIALAA